MLLFNLCGYRLVIDFLQQQQAQTRTAQLDKAEYANEDLISIKTPLSLPYYNASTDFERVDGAIQINGVEYSYVKRRIINDSLELLCLPNTAKQKLQAAKSDFFKITNDLQRPEGSKKPTAVIKAAIPDYCNALPVYGLLSLHKTTQKHAVTNSRFIPACFATIPAQPPESMRLFS